MQQKNENVHNIQSLHMQSFRSSDYTSKLISSLFELKFTLTKAITEIIIKNVFAKEAQLRLNDAIQKNNYFSVMVETIYQ